MQTASERVELICAALVGESFTYSEDKVGAYLLDDEGETVTRLSEFFVETIASLRPEGVAEVLRYIYLANVGKSERSYATGMRQGRAAVLNTVHELLGVDKIVEALCDLASAAREIRGD